MLKAWGGAAGRPRALLRLLRDGRRVEVRRDDHVVEIGLGEQGLEELVGVGDAVGLDDVAARDTSLAQ